MEKDLKRLEDECINNVEDAFNNYLLNDLTEAGEVEDLIGDLDWYLFWRSNASEINWRINYLIENNDSIELLKRAVILKRVIDGNIIKYASIDEIRRDLELSGKVSNGQIISLNIEYEKAKEFVNNFHAILLSEGLIDSSLDEFTARFFKSKSVSQINWIGKQNNLLGLMKILTSKKLISLTGRTLTNLIVNNFTIRGREINQRSIEVGLSSVDDNMEKYPAFHDLINRYIGNKY